MKRGLLERLCCPECRGELNLEAATTSGPEDIATGHLRCRNCSRAFPITRGVPRLLPDSLSAGALATAAAFEFEWQHYPKTNPYTVDQFLDWIAPLSPAFFRDKLVLDAGCGTGGFAAYAAEFGARQVLAMDISGSVEVAANHLNDHPTLSVIQGSIESPPLTGGMDFIFSIGVIHHLESPSAGIRSLARLLRPGGTLFVWVYGRENNGPLLALLLPLRRVARRTPYRLLKWGVALPVATLLYPILRRVYLPASGPRLSKLPYADYLRWLSNYDFSFVHGVILDQLIAPTAYYMRHEEVESAFHSAGLVDVKLSARNANSWRAMGVRAHDSVLEPTPAAAHA
jgi:SAM-dependent methyltransferase